MYQRETSLNSPADIPAMYHVQLCIMLCKSLTTKCPKSFRSSLNVSDFYSVNPMERLDRIGIEVGRYRRETHQSCRNFYKSFDRFTYKNFAIGNLFYILRLNAQCHSWCMMNSCAT